MILVFRDSSRCDHPATLPHCVAAPQVDNAVSLLALPVRCREGGRFQQAVLWSKTLQLDTRCQTVTMTPMQVVVALQSLLARGCLRLEDSAPEPLEDVGQPEAAP